MNQSNKKKKIQLHMPLHCDHSCKGDYMPIANVEDITPENNLRRAAKNGPEISE